MRHARWQQCNCKYILNYEGILRKTAPMTLITILQTVMPLECLDNYEEKCLSLFSQRRQYILHGCNSAEIILQSYNLENTLSNVLIKRIFSSTNLFDCVPAILFEHKRIFQKPAMICKISVFSHV